MEIIRLREHDDMAMSDQDRSVNGLVQRQSMELLLHIGGGEGIDVDDEDKHDTLVKRRCYCVCVAHSMEPDKWYYTEAQAAWNNPLWNQRYCIPIIENIPGNYGFLYVEVAKLYSGTDPGTSSGTVIVGRAKVPLPREPYNEVGPRFELARPSGDGHMRFAGNIILHMVLTIKRKYVTGVKETLPM